VCCLRRVVSGLRNRSRFLFRFSYKDSLKFIRLSSVDICVLRRIFFHWFARFNYTLYKYSYRGFVNKFYFFFRILYVFVPGLVFIICQIFPFTSLFRYLHVSMLILHVMLNHIAALDCSIFCLVFLQLQAVLTCYTTNSELTQSPHCRLYKDKSLLDPTCDIYIYIYIYIYISSIWHIKSLRMLL